MTFTQETLYRLARTETPPWKPPFYYEDRQEQCKDYCDLRNAAKDLSARPEDKEAEGELTRLIKKLDIQIK